MKKENKTKIKKFFLDWSVIASVCLSLLYFGIWFLPDILDLFIRDNADFLKEYDAKMYQHLLTLVFFLRSVQSYLNFNSSNGRKKIDLRKSPNKRKPRKKPAPKLLEDKSNES